MKIDITQYEDSFATTWDSSYTLWDTFFKMIESIMAWLKKYIRWLKDINNHVYKMCYILYHKLY